MSDVVDEINDAARAVRFGVAHSTLIGPAMYEHMRKPLEKAAAEVTALRDKLASAIKERDEARAGTTKAHAETRAFWDALVQKGPRCRDCADFDGRCQGDGPPCDPQAHALENLAKLQARALAATAESDRLRRALEPFANCIFNDNGDITVNFRPFTADELIAAYFAYKKAQALTKEQTMAERKLTDEQVQRSRSSAEAWLSEREEGWPRSWDEEARATARRGYDMYDDGFECPTIAGYEALENDGHVERIGVVLKRTEERIHFRLTEAGRAALQKGSRHDG